METPDYSDLLRRASLWATGATIHDVKQLSGSIQLGMSALGDHKRKDMVTPAKRRWCELWLARLARTLESYMSHGDSRRADRENPETDEEKRLYEDFRTQEAADPTTH